MGLLKTSFEKKGRYFFVNMCEMSNLVQYYVSKFSFGFFPPYEFVSPIGMKLSLYETFSQFLGSNLRQQGKLLEKSFWDKLLMIF